jgi:hypothetical protein
MPQIAEIEGIGNVEFDDSFTPDQIADKVKNEVIPQFQRRKARLSQLTAERAQFENEQATRSPSLSDRMGAATIAALDQGPSEFLRQGYSILEAGSRPFSASDSQIFARKAQAARADVQRAAEEAQTLDPSATGRVAQTVASTATSSAPLMAASVVAPILAGPALAVKAAVGASALAGAGQSFGAVFNDAKNTYMEQGLSEDEAARRSYVPAIASGAWTGALTSAFGATGIQAIAKGFGKESAKATFIGILRNAAPEAVHEMSEEGLDQLGQGFVERLTFNPKKTIADIAEETLMAGLAGGLLGGGANVGFGLAGKASEAVDAGRTAFDQRRLATAFQNEEAATDQASAARALRMSDRSAVQALDPNRSAQYFAPRQTPVPGNSVETQRNFAQPGPASAPPSQGQMSFVLPDEVRAQMAQQLQTPNLVAEIAPPPVVMESLVAAAPTTEQSSAVAPPIAQPSTETAAVPVAETATTTPTQTAIANDLQDISGLRSEIQPRSTTQQEEPVAQTSQEAAPNRGIFQAQEAVQTPPAVANGVFYRSGITSSREGVTYVADDPTVAALFAEGGEFGRPGAKLETLRGNLKIFDSRSASPEETLHILGRKALKYVEPDGLLNFTGFEGDPSIRQRLQESGYDAIRISEGSNGNSIAVLNESFPKLSSGSNPPVVTTEQPHGFVSLVDFNSSALNPKVGTAFDVDLPDVSTPGNMVALEQRLLTGARQSSAQGSKRSITHKFLAVVDNNDGQVYLLPVYEDTKSGFANTVAPNAAGEPRGQRLSRVLGEKSAGDISEPRYEVLEGVRLKNPARTFPRTFTREEWSQIRSDALAEQEATTNKLVGDVEPAEGLIDTPTAAVVEAVIPPGHLAEHDLREIFRLYQQNPELKEFATAASPIIQAIEREERTVWEPATFAQQLNAVLNARPQTFDQFYDTFDPSGYAEWKERTIRSNRSKYAGGPPVSGTAIPQTPGLPTTFATPQEAIDFLTAPGSPVASNVGNVLVAALTDPALQKSLGALGFKLSVQNAAVSLAEGATTGRHAAYDPVTGTVLLALGIRDAEAGPHELAHHLETLLPQADRKALDNARQSAISKELRRADLTAEQRAFLEALRAGQKSSAWFDSQFQSIGPAIEEFYPLINTSEFFAKGFSERYLNRINATHQERGLWGRIKEMLKRVYAWLKDRVGLTSAQDAAFQRLISGDFEVTARNGMLFDDGGLSGSASHVFTSSQEVADRAGAVDLTPDQVAGISRVAQAQTSIVPQAFTAQLDALNSDTSTPEGVAKRELGYLSDIGSINAGVPTPQQLATMPANTEQELLERESAADAAIRHYQTVDDIRSGLSNKMQKASEELAKAVKKIPARNKAEAQEAMLAAMSDRLLTGYKQYLADQAALTAPNSTIQGQRNALLEAMQRRVADAEITPSSIRKALEAISLHIPDVVLNAAKDPHDILVWVQQNPNLLNGVISQSVQDFLTDTMGGPTGLQFQGLANPTNPFGSQQYFITKSPLEFKGIIEQLKGMRALRQQQDATLNSVKNFKSWFSGGGRPTVVGSDAFARAYYRYRSKQEKAAAIVSAIDKDIAHWDNEIRGLLLAEQHLDALRSTPEWQAGLTLASNLGDVMMRDVERADPRTGVTEYIGPITGEKFYVNLSPDADVENENMTSLMKLVAEFDQFAADPNSDPVRKRDAAKRSAYLKQYKLRPDFNPDAGTMVNYWDVGPGVQVKIDPIGTFRRVLGGLPSTMNHELRSLAGRAATDALQVAQQADQIEQYLETLQNNADHGGKAINIASVQAAQAHGYQGNKGVLLWERDVLNPILASGQSFGSPVLKVGMTLPTSGKVVIQSDIDAIEKMKAWNRDVLKTAQGAPESRTARYFNPVQVVDETGKVNRNAVGSGVYTMARAPSRWGFEFSQEWKRAGNDLQRVGLLRDPVNFQQAVLGRIAEQSSEFNQGRLGPVFAQMASEMKKGRRYNTMDDVLDDMANRMVAARMAPNYATALNEAKRDLFSAINSDVAAIDKVFGDANNSHDRNRPDSLIDVVTADNSFTKPRQGLVAPSTYFDYSMAQNGRRAQFTNSLRNVMRLREVEAMQGVLAQFRSAKLDFDNRIKALEMQGKTPAQARKQVGNESRAEQLAGKRHVDLYELEKTIKSLERILSETERIASLRDDHFDGALIQGLNKTRAFLGTSLLATAGSSARNTFGSGLVQATLSRILGRSWHEILRNVATFGRHIGKSLALQLTHATVGNPNLHRMLTRNAPLLAKVTSGIAQWANQWEKIQAQMDEIGVSPNTQIMQAVKLRGMLPETGGKITTVEPGAIANLATAITTLPGIRKFSVGGRVIGEGAKAIFPGFFDRAINAGAMAFWNGEEAALKAKAFEAFARKESINGPGWDDLTRGDNLLQPSDLGTNHLGMKQWRDNFASVGLMDRVLLDWYNKVKNLPPDQRAAVPILAPEEEAQVALEHLKTVNVGTETNRPTFSKGSGIGGTVRQALGQFTGFPSEILNLISRLEKRGGKDSGNAGRYALHMAVLTLLAIIIGGAGNELAKWLNRATTGEATSAVGLENITDANTALRWLATALGTVVPGVGEPLSRVLGGTSNKPLMDITQLTPLFGATADAAMALQKIAQTHEFVYPVADFVRRWVPLAKPALLLIPGALGDQAARNANRAVTAAVPPEMEPRKQSGGGAPTQTPMTPILRDLMAAAYAGDQQRVASLYQAAVEEKRHQGSPDPEGSVLSSIQSQVPTRKVLGRVPTAAEEATILSRMSGTQRADFEKSRRAFALLEQTVGKSIAFTKRIRPTATRARSRGLLGGGRSVLGRRRQSFPRLRLGSGRSRRTVGTGRKKRRELV